MIGLIAGAVYWLCIANKWKLGWYVDILAAIAVGTSSILMGLYLNGILMFLFIPFDILGIMSW